MNRSIFTADIDVRWRDLDAFNHVNNGSHLGYIEETRVRWFKSLSEDWTNATSAPIVAAININYRRPIAWPELLRVELFAERIGNKSLTLAHTIVSATHPDRLFADGNTVMVWVDRNGHSVLLPDRVRVACADV